MTRSSLLPLVLAGLLTSTASLLRAASTADFKDFSYDLRHAGNIILPGRLYVPPVHDPAGAGYDPHAAPSPLVIFFHGHGQKGTDNSLQVVNASIDNLLAKAKSRGFFLYAPQTHNDWFNDRIETTMQMAARALREYNVDPDRIYVTGLSMGGNGVYTAASDYHDILAAAVPVCPGDGFNVVMANLVGKPIWIFHARGDTATNAQYYRSRARVNAIRAADGLPALTWPLEGNPFGDGSTFYDFHELKHIEFGTGGHPIWDDVYKEALPSSPAQGGAYPLYDWLLGKSLVATPVQAGETVLIDFGNNRLAGVDAQGRLWNGTLAGWEKTAEAAVAFAVTTAGRRTSIIADVVSNFGNHTQGGIAAGSPYDALVAQDGWSTTIHATAAMNTGVLKFRGLEPGATYRLDLWASHTDSDGDRGRLTRYEVNGAFADLEAHGNAASKAVLPAVVADADGSFSLRVYPTPEGGGRYGQINALELTFVAPAAVPVAVLFEQDFASSANVADYIAGAAAPASGSLFSFIGSHTAAAGLAQSITDGSLVFFNASSTAAYGHGFKIISSDPPAAQPRVLIYELDVNIDYTDKGWGPVGQLEIGNPAAIASRQVSVSLATADRWCALDFRKAPANFYITNPVAGTPVLIDSLLYQADVKILLIANAGAGPATYAAPTGSESTVQPGCFSLFYDAGAGWVMAAENLAKNGGYADLGGVRFARTNVQEGTYQAINSVRITAPQEP